MPTYCYKLTSSRTRKEFYEKILERYLLIKHKKELSFERDTPRKKESIKP